MLTLDGVSLATEVSPALVESFVGAEQNRQGRWTQRPGKAGKAGKGDIVVF